MKKENELKKKMWWTENNDREKSFAILKRLKKEGKKNKMAKNVSHKKQGQMYTTSRITKIPLQFSKSGATAYEFEKIK